MLIALQAKKIAEEKQREKIEQELEIIIEKIEKEAMDGKTSLKFNYELYEKNKEELIKLGYEVETRFYESGDLVGIAEVYTFISWDNAKEEEAEGEEEEAIEN